MSNKDIHESPDQPKGGDERAFKAKHKVKVTDHPEGTKLPPITTSKKKRLADPVDTEVTYEDYDPKAADDAKGAKHAEKMFKKASKKEPSWNKKWHDDHAEAFRKKAKKLFKKAVTGMDEETDSTFSIFWRDANGMDKQKHGLSEEEVTRLASALEAAGSVKIFIDEEEMTDEQMKKREKYVKGMKSKDDDLRKRYGKRWKDVMYAIATKNAMREEAESLDEIAKSEEEPLHVQLRKRTNANEVSLTFKNGKTHVVSRGHANKAIAMLSGMKPADRQHAHAEMSKSHEHFMDALEGKLSKPSKAGISLGGGLKKEDYDNVAKNDAEMNARIAKRARNPKEIAFWKKATKKNEKKAVTGMEEEVESLDETEQNTAADVAYRKHLRAAVAAKERAEAVGKDHPDYKKHMAVFLSHRKKMMGEDIESLDELDRDGMIRRYAKKTADRVASGEDDEEKRAKGRLLAGKKRWGGTGGIPAAKVPAVQREDVESLDEVGGQSSQVSPTQPVSRPVVKPPAKKTTPTANTTVTEAGNIIPPASKKMKSFSDSSNNYKLDRPRTDRIVPTQKDRSLEMDE